MRSQRWLGPAVAILILVALAPAQVTTLNLPAGSPADQDLQTISKEADPAKQKAMYEEFVTKYAADAQAAAYGYSQLAQLAFAAGDARSALEFGDKSLAAVPGNLEMIVSQVQFAQALKDAGKIVDYAERGAKVVHGIGSQPKPAGMSD